MHAGDWFNRLDYSGQTNNFGVGLPVATKNRESWPLKQPLLAQPCAETLPAAHPGMQAALSHAPQDQVLTSFGHAFCTAIPSAHQLLFDNAGPEGPQRGKLDSLSLSMQLEHECRKPDERFS